LQKHGEMPTIAKLRNSVLDGRFKVKGKLSEGSFGQIYTGYDSKNRVDGIKNPVIIKFTQNHAMNDQEFEALIKVNKFAHKNNCMDSFSNTYSKGKCFVTDPTLVAEKSKPSKKPANEEEKLTA